LGDQNLPSVSSPSSDRFLTSFSSNTGVAFGVNVFGASWQVASTLDRFTAEVDYVCAGGVNLDFTYAITLPTQFPVVSGAPWTLFQPASLAFGFSEANAGQFQSSDQKPLQSPLAGTGATLDQVNKWLSDGILYAPPTFFLDNFSVWWAFNDGVSPLNVSMPFLNKNSQPEVRVADIELNQFNRRSVYLLSPANFECNDAFITADSLWYNVSNLVGGYFAYVDNQKTIVVSFSQQQILDSKVVFVDRGNNEPPTNNNGSPNRGAVVTGMDVVCSNGILNSNPVTVNVLVASSALFQPILPLFLVVLLLL